MKQIYNKVKVRAAVMAALLVTASMAATAQVRITGSVKDGETSEAISGATIVVPGTSISTLSTGNGAFSITVPSAAQKLVFSSVGFRTDTIAINNRTQIDVLMEETARQIEDLVFIGYGTVQRKDLTGAVTSVKLNDTEASTTDSFDKLIQGRVAGVQVVNSSSAPGGVSEITIRGASSFNNSSEPLYVVDGIILNPSDVDARSTFSTGTADVQQKENALSTINPSDILSMEVLKDASATAIYGSQGANGVIIITTKSGTSKKAAITFNTSLQFSEPSKYLPMLNMNQFIAMHNENNQGMGQLGFVDSLSRSQDWQRWTMGQRFSPSYRMSISGRTDDTEYYFSGSFNQNNGIIRNSSTKQSNMRVNLKKTVNKVVSIGTNSNFSYSNNNMASNGEGEGTENKSLVKQMIVYHPYNVPDKQLTYDPDAEDDETAIEGPKAWINSYQDHRREWRIQPSFYVNLNLMSWLSFRSTLGGDYRRKWVGRSYGGGTYQGDTNFGVVGVTNFNSVRWNLDNYFQFNKKFGRHNIQGTLGQSAQSTFTESFQLQNNGFDNYASAMRWGPDAMFMGKQMNPGASTYSESTANMASFYLRAIYSYANRYTVTGTIRADGSSKFKGSNKFGYFPSFAAAWKINEESFMRSARKIDLLKLRAGWGLTGNQSMSAYQTLDTYTSTLYMTPPTGWMATNPVVNGLLTAYVPDGIPNQRLKWETTSMFNFGVDLSAFKNRLNLTVDYYLKNTYDLLQSLIMPQEAIANNAWVNQGSIRNRGLEISIDGTPIKTRSFSFSLGGNITFNRNTVTDTGLDYTKWGTNTWSAFQGKVVGNGNTNINHPVNIFIKGKPMSLFYGLKTDGIIQTGETGPVTGTDASSGTPGHVKFVDQDGNGQINDDDYVIIGNPNPKFTGGFFFSFTWKNLSLDANFTASYGNDILNGNLVIENNVGTTVPANLARNVRRDAYFQAWRPDAPSNTYPGLGMFQSTSNVIDKYVEDGSFLRLSNISLSWRIPLQKKLGWINSVNLSVSGRNLWLLSNYSGWDPEVNSFSFNPQMYGIDWGSYPNSRAIIVGIGLTF